MPDERPSDQAGLSGTDENLNPFEIAMQQFDIAADALHLDDSMRHALKKAKRQHIVSIPVKMDGGEVHSCCRIFSRARAASRSVITSVRGIFP
jgi:FMN phosphatase YigB (HAD superfamily)